MERNGVMQNKNMENDQIKKIISRLEKLEDAVFVVGHEEIKKQVKQSTLAEIVRGKKIKSGQQKVAVIVGYYEKIIKKTPLKETDLKKGWKEGKFDGKYNPNFLARAIKDGFVRNIEGDLDLSQTGEKFYGDLSK